jgi:hypothetical protein
MAKRVWRQARHAGQHDDPSAPARLLLPGGRSGASRRSRRAANRAGGGKEMLMQFIMAVLS